MPANKTPQDNTDAQPDRSGEIRALEQQWLKKNRQEYAAPPTSTPADPANDIEQKGSQTE